MERFIVWVIGVVSEGESGSKLPMFYDIIIEDIVFVGDAWVFNKGVPMSLEEFYWEDVDSIVCGIVEGKVISPIGFLGDSSNRSCDVRR